MCAFFSSVFCRLFCEPVEIIRTIEFSEILFGIKSLLGVYKFMQESIAYKASEKPNQKQRAEKFFL